MEGGGAPRARTPTLTLTLTPNLTLTLTLTLTRRGSSSATPSCDPTPSTTPTTCRSSSTATRRSARACSVRAWTTWARAQAARRCRTSTSRSDSTRPLGSEQSPGAILSSKNLYGANCATHSHVANGVSRHACEVSVCPRACPCRVCAVGQRQGVRELCRMRNDHTRVGFDLSPSARSDSLGPQCSLLCSQSTRHTSHDTVAVTRDDDVADDERHVTLQHRPT